MRDRTKERQAQLAVQQSELRFRTLAEHIPQLVWRSARLGHRTWPSPQWIEYTGQSAQESIGLGWLDAVHPQDRELTIEAWHEAERTGQLYVEHRTRRAADGEYRWFQTRATRLPVPRMVNRNGSAPQQMFTTCAGRWNGSKFSPASCTIARAICWELSPPSRARRSSEAKSGRFWRSVR